MTQPRYLAAGDTALTVELGDTATLDLSLRVLALYRRIEAENLPGVIEVVPAIRSLTVHFDPCSTSQRALRLAIEPLAGRSAEPLPRDGAGPQPAGAPTDRDNASGTSDLSPPPRRWLIPACYEPTFGPDLEAVAATCGLKPWQVSALHASVSYRVLMIGFLPGHPYMGELPPPLQIPRRATPRTAVVPGSIAIATTMSVIYPQESPGGWHIIARTPVRLFDPAWPQPSLLGPGDQVRFRPITVGEHDALADADRAGIWRLEPEEEVS